MPNWSTSTKTYAFLVFVLAALSAVAVFLPQGDFTTSAAYDELPIPKGLAALANLGVALLIYGGLGFIGMKLAKKVGFADLWDERITNRERFVRPLVIGLAIGVVFIISDLIFTSINSVGALPHPPFPLSLVASITAGIGEEIIFRLFFISFWVWLVSYVLLKNKLKEAVFWTVATVSAIAFAAGHLPGLMFLYGFSAVSELPIVLILEILFLNGLVALPAAYYFREYGFLAAVGIHFWVDVVWHVIYGLV